MSLTLDVQNDQVVIETSSEAATIDISQLPTSTTPDSDDTVPVLVDGVLSNVTLADLITGAGFAALTGATFTGGVTIDDSNGDAVLTLEAFTAASVGVSSGDAAEIVFKQASTTISSIRASSVLGAAWLTTVYDEQNARILISVVNGAAASANTTISDKLIVKRGTSGQTANLLELDDHSSNVLTAVGPSGYVEMTEQTAPSAPAANKVRIYAQDNGSGKTQLMALFSSGAAQQIAIQP